MKQHDAVVLIEEFKDVPLFSIGCIVEIFNNGESYLVEWYDDSGDSMGIDSVKPNEIKLYES